MCVHIRECRIRILQFMVVREFKDPTCFMMIHVRVWKPVSIRDFDAVRKELGELPIQRRNMFLPLSLQESGFARDRTTPRGLSLLGCRVRVHMRMDMAGLLGHRVASGAGHC